MTDAEAKTKVPEDVAKELGKLAKQSGMDLKTEIVPQYKEIFQQDYLAAMEEGERHKYALMILKGQLHIKLVSNAKPFMGQLIDFGSPRSIKKEDDEFLVCNAYMRLRPMEPKDDAEEEFRFAEITLWRDQTGLVKAIERGKWYECAFNVKSDKNGMLFLNSDESTNFRPIEQINGAIPLGNFLDTIWERIPLKEFDKNLSKGQPSNPDYRLAIGTVLTQRKIPKEDREIGVYTIIDESLDLDAAKSGDEAHQGFTVWCSGSQARYKKGSIIQVIGRFSKKEDGKRAINGNCINPIVVTEIDDKAVGLAASAESGAGDAPVKMDARNLDLDDI